MYFYAPINNYNFKTKQYLFNNNNNNNRSAVISHNDECLKSDEKGSGHRKWVWLQK